jgi:hypothetical protein
LSSSDNRNSDYYSSERICKAILQTFNILSLQIWVRNYEKS